MINNVIKCPISTIFEINLSSAYYKIPKYQREYTWSYNEWDALYNDIIDNDNGYFIGSIIGINIGDSSAPALEIIDGQQRLTTISILLAAIYKNLKPYRKEDEDEDDDESISVECSGIRKRLKRKNSQENGLVLVPQIQNNNSEDYKYAIKAEAFGEKLPKPKYWDLHRIGMCFKHFDWLINSTLEDSKAPVKTLLDILEKVTSAMLVKIEVDSHADAYILFESLNNRGTPLTAIELMKNLIMARAKNAGLTVDSCYDRWQNLLGYLSDDYQTQERFFRHFYNAFKRTLNEPFIKDDDKKKDQLGYVATRSNLLKIYESLINYDLRKFLDDILICGEYYSFFVTPESAPQVYRNNLTDLLHIQGVPAYLLLLFLFTEQQRLGISETTMDQIIRLLVIYFVRRNVTDFPATRDLTRIFMDIVEKIDEEKVIGDNVYNFIKIHLAVKTASDDAFEEKLSGNIYDDNAGAARFLLCTLAEHAMTTETKTNLWARNNRNVYIWTIEHIFPEGKEIPQALVNMIADGDKEKAKEYQVEFVHRIGNLTITGFNSNLSNSPFIQKRDKQNQDSRFIGYRNGLEINREIADKEMWTVDDIKTRTKRLVAQLMEMFRFPE